MTRKTNLILAGLKLILDNRDVLFDERNADYTKRRVIWTQVFETLVENGMEGTEKSYKTVRDVWWPNTKRSSINRMTKVVKSKPYHKEIDSVVKEIIGAESFNNLLMTTTQQQLVIF